jgi:hypothetical protein
MATYRYLDDVQWLSIAGRAPREPDASDMETRAVLAMLGDVRLAGEAGLAAIAAAHNDLNLSDVGKRDAARRAGVKALGELRAYAALEASRKALTARLAETSVPGLDSVPFALVPMIHARLAGIDSVLRMNVLREAVEIGDTAAAVVAVNLPSPLRQDILTDKEAAEITEALRVRSNAPAARRAAALAEAIEVVEKAAKAVAGKIASAAGIAVDDAAMRAA